MDDWIEQAACRAYPAEWWFPERGDMVALNRAKTICKSCPVQAECLAYALSFDTRDGVWGATSETQRRRLRADVARAEGRYRFRAVCVVCGAPFVAGGNRAKLCGSADCRRAHRSEVHRRYKERNQ